MVERATCPRGKLRAQSLAADVPFRIACYPLLRRNGPVDPIAPPSPWRHTHDGTFPGCSGPRDLVSSWSNRICRALHLATERWQFARNIKLENVSHRLLFGPSDCDRASGHIPGIESPDIHWLRCSPGLILPLLGSDRLTSAKPALVASPPSSLDFDSYRAHIPVITPFCDGVRILEPDRLLDTGRLGARGLVGRAGRAGHCTPRADRKEPQSKERPQEPRPPWSSALPRARPGGRQ
jgi:hypothetical protein